MTDEQAPRASGGTPMEPYKQHYDIGFQHGTEDEQDGSGYDDRKRAPAGDGEELEGYLDGYIDGFHWESPDTEVFL